MHKKISIIIPALNEAACIRDCLLPLQPLRERGHEVIVVDGGSSDDTREIAGVLSDSVINCDRGRAVQMNAGAAASTGDVLVFLHADTQVSAGSMAELTEIADPAWGCFSVRLSGSGLFYRVYSYCINLRARISGIVTGDQVLFVARALFEEIGGFPRIPLMEDVAISKRLKAFSRPVIIDDEVITSTRRWEQHGRLRTMLKMWLLRCRFALGASPAALAKEYD